MFKRNIKKTINSSCFDLRNYTAGALSNIKRINSSFLILPKSPDEEFITALSNIELNNSNVIRLEKEISVDYINGECELSKAAYKENSFYIVNGCMLIKRIDNENPIKLVVNGIVAYDKHTKINPFQVNGECFEIPFDDAYESKTFGNRVCLNNQFFENISKSTIVCCGNKLELDTDVKLDTLKSKNILLVAGNKIICSKEIIGYVNLIGKVGNRIESYGKEKNQ
ncbi:MAG: hypothetical protein NC213_08475 [Acetobacter sp.]|nr:hypothetical protein [Bacteroides sp.]MCM1341763.1 hypothetical protein [Acetobacter sp.]MCM1433106.1 hypothetical protein [Clostridiales bacterium]